MAYHLVHTAHIAKLIGGPSQEAIPLAQIVAEAHEKSHLFFVIPGDAAHGHDEQVHRFWANLFGQDHVLSLASPDDTAECIAMAIGMTEGVVTPDEARQQMIKRGKIGQSINRILQCVSGLFTGRTPAAPLTGKRRL